MLSICSIYLYKNVIKVFDRGKVGESNVVSQFGVVNLDDSKSNDTFIRHVGEVILKF